MNKVLKDHKQVGKKLQPPFLNYFDDWQTLYLIQKKLLRLM